MSSKIRFLLIDDDALDRLAVTRALRQSQCDYELVEATSAAAGLKLAASERFDAILLDFRLPDQDGLEVLRLLRSGQFNDVAVIMLSHQEDEALASQCLENGAQDYLLKGEVNGRQMMRAVRQAQQRYVIEGELRASREQLRQLSETDPLTGLINRRGFENALATAIARAKRGDHRLALLLLDLDEFKSINDTLGHAAGDALLVEVSRRFRATIRDSDVLCRLGGDEFVVLMTHFEQNAQAALLADRIIACLQRPVFLGTVEKIITASIGIALFDDDASDASDLLKFADIAMYRAKQSGRNQSRCYSPGLQEAVLNRSNMRHDMLKGLERGEFKVFYQPQIRSFDRRLSGMEALLRWDHPRLGLLLPSAFLSVAEETGLIVELGSWVLKESCRQLADWKARLPSLCSQLTLAVNVSCAQLTSNSLVVTIDKALAESGLSATCLELEITENALIKDTSEAVALFSTIAGQGVTLSLDDFGTGYSSLEHLRLFPIDVLKIDKEFVSAIGNGKKREKLLLAIIAFAKALEIKVIAEGVETKEQAAFCVEHGCDALQGFYFAKALPANEFEAAFLS